MKNRKYIWSKRGKLRRFIDLMNELDIFEEKLPYPVMHPRKVIEYEDKRNMWYITKECFDNLYKNLSSRERDEMVEFFKKNFEEDKKNFPKVEQPYVDFKMNVTFKDGISEICPSSNLEKKKKEFYNYFCGKIEKVPNFNIESEIRDSENIFFEDADIIEFDNLNLLIKVEDNRIQECQYRWSYFMGVHLLKTNNENKINTCEIAFYTNYCCITIYCG